MKNILHFRLKPLLLSAVVLLMLPELIYAQPALTFRGDFEHGITDLRGRVNTDPNTGSPWIVVKNGTFTPKVVTTPDHPVRYGNYAAMSHLDRPTNPASYRAEISPRLRPSGVHPRHYKTEVDVQFQQDNWYAFSVFIPNNWVNDNVNAILSQWRGVEDAADTLGRNPLIAMSVKKGTVSVRGLWDSRAVSPSKEEADANPNIERYEGSRTYWTGSLADMKGKWVDFAFKIRWSWRGDGRFNMWKDGNLVASESGPNAFNDLSPAAFRVGFYKASWKKSLADLPLTSSQVTAYYDEIRLAGADGNLLLVSPPDGSGGHRGNNPGCTLDADGNGISDALTDGLLFTRYMFGSRGNALIANAVGSNCTRCTAAEIEPYMAQCKTSLASDIDGNGEVDALTDGLLITRYLFGSRGAALIENAVANDCTRCTATENEIYLESSKP